LNFIQPVLLWHDFVFSVLQNVHLFLRVLYTQHICTFRNSSNFNLGGGHYTTTNRTKWPITGGAIALQPGWFQGHATAFFYMNLGFGTDGPDHGPPNMSFPMVPVFQIVGPSKNPYPGTFCLPQVPLPVNASVKVGDNATIQVVETALHGAALYSVSRSSSSSNCPQVHPNVIKTVRRYNLRRHRRPRNQ
jgi:hypothetical protein